MVSPLQLWTWRGEDLVVAFILDHGQQDHINAVDAGFFGTPATALDFCLAHQQKLQQCLREWERSTAYPREIYRADDGEVRSVPEDRKTLQKLREVEATLRQRGGLCASELGERFDDVGMLD